jgi:toxin ParE1/3/4
MRPYRLHPEAFQEVDEAASFYKERQPGLEKRFLEALQDAIARIRRNPLMYRRVEGEVRKCRVPHFPYGLIFRVDENDSLEILAVMHLRRRPGYWKPVPIGGCKVAPHEGNGD